MREYFPNDSGSNGNFVYVGFRLAEPSPDDTYERDFTTYPEPVGGSFLSLGIDVVDWLLFSPLANLRAFEEADMKERLANLNDWGLAGSLEDARELRICCESEYPDHTPFALVEILVELSSA